MKRALLWLLTALLVAGVALALLTQGGGYIPALAIVGDVEAAELCSPEELGEAQSVELEGERYRAVPLLTVLSSVGAAEELRSVVFVSPDGFSAEVDGSTAGECFIAFTERDGWRAVCPQHPISANAKHLSRIIVVAEPEAAYRTLAVVTPEGTEITTPGALLAGNTAVTAYREGQAVTEHGGETYTSAVYTRRVCVEFETLGLTGGVSLLTESGSIVRAADGGLLSLYGNEITYLEPEGRASSERVTAVFQGLPGASITDVYYHARHYLNGGESVTVVFARGLTASSLSKAEGGFLTSAFTPTAACGVSEMTGEAWERAALRGLDGGAPLEVNTVTLDFDGSFDGAVREICESSGDVVIIAPLPGLDAELSYDTLNAVYLLPKE